MGNGLFGRFVAAEVLVNRDPSEYKPADDAFDLAGLGFLIDNLLLGKKEPFPVRHPNEFPPGVEQHNFSGTGYDEKPLDEIGPK